MAPVNHAAWLKAKQDPTMVVEPASYTPPSANELVIQTKAIALNPVDFGIQSIGILVTQYPAIVGCDVAGEVVEVHPSLVSQFAVGDRVIGAATPLALKDGVFCYAGFQEYVVLRSPTIAKIPDSITYEDGAVLPLGFNTAASCLFPKELLGLSMPSSGKEAGQGKTLLVWGASSSVGSCGVQLATLAGYEVVAVASKKNHDMVKSLGAKTCFDQSDTNLVQGIVANLKGKDVVGAFDAISTDATLPSLCEILDVCGGTKKIAAVMPGVEAKSTRGVDIQTNFLVLNTFKESGMLETVWRWLEKALGDGEMKCMPQHEVVGHGLDDIQKAVGLMGKGVSAKKLVVSL